MRQKPITRFFAENLSAPVRNTQWSWGAVREDGVVFLRIYEHELITDDHQYALLSGPRWQLSPHGFRERQQHLAQIRTGAPCYLVVLVAKNADLYPLEIDHYHDRELLIGGSLFDRDDHTCLEIVGRTSPMAVRLRRQGAPS